MTYTYAILDISPAAYAEIRQKLEAAGYQQAFHRDEGTEILDMHGIALQAEPEAPAARFPRGRLNADDEGATEIGVAVDQDCVVIAFTTPTAWVGMPTEQAEDLARVIAARAAEARRNRQ